MDSSIADFTFKLMYSSNCNLIYSTETNIVIHLALWELNNEFSAPDFTRIVAKETKKNIFALYFIILATFYWSIRGKKNIY
jgi:hypothetical protein